MKRATISEGGWTVNELAAATVSREEWLKIRSEFDGLTGSVAPILHSAIAYNSLELEYDRRGRGTVAEPPGFMATRGTVLEPHILLEVTNKPIAERPLCFEIIQSPMFIRHPVHEWAACSPDFLAVSTDDATCEAFGTRIGSRIVAEPLRICGEIKSRDGTQGYKYKDGRYQLSERCQVIWNSACCDADVGLLLVEMFGVISPIHVERDRQFEIELFESARVFLDAVEARDVGALIELTDKASERWDLVRATFAEGKGDALEIEDDDVDAMIDDLERFKSAKKTAEADIKTASAEIGRVMKNAEKMTTARYRASWSTLKTGKRGGLRIKEIGS